MSISKILSLLIPIITLGLWGYFFVTIISQGILLSRFFLVVLLIPMISASIYIMLLLRRRSKPGVIMTTFAVWLYFLFIIMGSELSLIRFLLVLVLLPILLASFHVAFLVWQRSRAEIPMIGLAIWSYFFLINIVNEEISLTKLFFVPVVISVFLASCYFILLAWRKSKPEIVSLLIPITTFVVWAYFSINTMMIGEISLNRFFLAFVVIPIVLVCFYIGLSVWSRKPRIGAILIPIATLAVWAYFFLNTLTAKDTLPTRLYLLSALIPILFASSCIAFFVWRKSRPKSTIVRS